MLAGVLKKSGHEVVETVNGVAAWDVLQQPDAPALVILDWMMPEMDGLEVVRRVRAVQTDRPPYIIMLTTKDAKVDIIAGLDAGANDYLAKPFDVGELRARVEVGRRMVEMQDALATKIAELCQALEQIKTLRGIVPICMHCKKIRDDQGYWKRVETYVGEHSEAKFSHGICPACVKEYYPELEEDAAGTGLHAGAGRYRRLHVQWQDGTMGRGDNLHTDRSRCRSRRCGNLPHRDRADCLLDRVCGVPFGLRERTLSRYGRCSRVQRLGKRREVEGAALIRAGHRRNELFAGHGSTGNIHAGRRGSSERLVRIPSAYRSVATGTSGTRFSR